MLRARTNRLKVGVSEDNFEKIVKGRGAKYSYSREDLDRALSPNIVGEPLTRVEVDRRKKISLSLLGGVQGLCKRKHIYQGANIYTSPKGVRHCRLCAHISQGKKIPGWLLQFAGEGPTDNQLIIFNDPPVQNSQSSQQLKSEQENQVIGFPIVPINQGCLSPLFSTTLRMRLLHTQ